MSDNKEKITKNECICEDHHITDAVEEGKEFYF